MDPSPPPGTLAADADRERTLVRLRDAAVEGRLTLDEFAERIDRAERARTHAELDTVTAGLPAAAPGDAALPARHRAVCSRLERRGRWGVAEQSAVVSVCGSILLDLGRATLPGPDTTIDVRNWFGTITLLVPRGVHVDVDGGGPLGTRDIDLPDTGPVRDAPRLRIRTRGVGGTLRIRTSSGTPQA